MAIRVDCELLGGCFGDPAHGAAEQVGQGPCPAVVCWDHGYIQACLRFPPGPGDCMNCRSHYKACNRGVFPLALSFAGLARIGYTPAAFGDGTALAQLSLEQGEALLLVADNWCEFQGTRMSC